MQQIVVEVSDDRKAHLLVEMLSAISFVDAIQIKRSGVSGKLPSEFSPDSQQSMMDDEIKAFGAMDSNLVQQYWGQYVAMHRGQVVDADSSLHVLSERIKDHYPAEVVLVRQVQQKLSAPIFVSSL